MTNIFTSSPSAVLGGIMCAGPGLPPQILADPSVVEAIIDEGRAASTYVPPPQTTTPQTPLRRAITMVLLFPLCLCNGALPVGSMIGGRRKSEEAETDPRLALMNNAARALVSGNRALALDGYERAAQGYVGEGRFFHASQAILKAALVHGLNRNFSEALRYSKWAEDNAERVAKGREFDDFVSDVTEADKKRLKAEALRVQARFMLEIPEAVAVLRRERLIACAGKFASSTRLFEEVGDIEGALKTCVWEAEVRQNTNDTPAYNSPYLKVARISDSMSLALAKVTLRLRAIEFQLSIGNLDRVGRGLSSVIGCMNDKRRMVNVKRELEQNAEILNTIVKAAVACGGRIPSDEELTAIDDTILELIGKGEQSLASRDVARFISYYKKAAQLAERGNLFIESTVINMRAAQVLISQGEIIKAKEVLKEAERVTRTGAELSLVKRSTNVSNAYRRTARAIILEAEKAGHKVGSLGIHNWSGSVNLGNGKQLIGFPLEESST